MSPRYYLVSAIIVFGLTIALSWWKQKKTGMDVFIVFCQVVLLLGLLLGTVFGLSELMAHLGIAQSGFIIKGEELK